MHFFSVANRDFGGPSRQPPNAPYKTPLQLSLHHRFSKPIFTKSGCVIKIVINFCPREQKQVFVPPPSVSEEARGAGEVLSI